MLKLKKGLALEDMSLMDTKLEFYDDLVEVIGKARTSIKTKKDRNSGLFSCGFVQDVQSCVKKHTGMSIKEIVEGCPAIYVPTLGSNHVFQKEIFSRYKGQWEGEYNDAKDVLDQMARLKKTSMTGEVNAKKAFVSGIFSTIELKMMMPEDMFEGKEYTDGEIAAIMLHEFGHAYTFFLYANRTILSNQILASLARTYEGSGSSEIRRVVFERYADEKKMSPDRRDALKKCKNPEELSVIYMSQEVEDCQSELGYSLYDVNSCEALADQFATRCGAGRDLASALNKIHIQYGMTDSGIWWGRLIGFFIGFLTNILLSFILAPAVFIALMFITDIFKVFGLIFGPDKRDEIYDNPFARLNRIKMQCVNRLKNDKIGKDEKERLLGDVESIDAMMVKYSDGLRLGEVAAWIFRPSYRQAHKFEMMQKQLEQIASNDLFASAAKLKMI
jgi:hypothetical protein